MAYKRNWRNVSCKYLVNLCILTHPKMSCETLFLLSFSSGELQLVTNSFFKCLISSVITPSVIPLPIKDPDPRLFGVLDSSLLNSSLVLCLLPLEELTVTEILPLFSLEGVLAWLYLCLSTPDAGCDNATVTWHQICKREFRENRFEVVL